MTLKELMPGSIVLTLVSVVLTAVILAALFAPVIAPKDPFTQDLGGRLAPPFWAPDGTLAHPLGTDGLGRDILSRIIYGARISVFVGLMAVGIQGSIGVVLGLTSGYFRGWADTVIMRLADVQLAIPFLVLALALIGILGPGLQNIIITLGLTGWMTYARVVRSEVLSVRESEFVEAAEASGAGHASILFRHILPNVSTSILVVATLQVARMIIAETALSYLGLGVQPPTPSWGGMVANGRDWMVNAWWVSTLPGVAIFMTVLSINLIGDYFRDFFDPTLEH